MLCHQLAAAHVAAMNMFTMLPGMEGTDRNRPPLPPAEVARLGNAGARLMEAYANGCLALQKLQTGGTQRVLVQHQQVAVTQNGPAVVMQTRRSQRRRGGGRRGDEAKNAR